ncbi:hypothetical protein PG999_007678 [Apiospora kogelbergensis]|uniref:Uncharacterized protein n=1 Tax=Apiospora kogelbergensis TaxID=1337665 RepID=A0AAW0QU75_9PEZI
MDTLPPEVKGPIIRLAMADDHGHNHWKYATVSREWQVLAEPVAFKTLDLDPHRLSEAAEIMTPLRQSHVRKISYALILPQIKEELSRSEAQRASEALFAELDNLLGHLRKWNMPSGKVKLVLGQWRPMDQAWLNLNDRMLLNLRPDDYRQLPEVPSITSFGVLVDTWLSPKACCEISTRFPLLRSIGWRLCDFHHESGVCGRRDFANALHLIPESVRKFGLEYSCLDDPTWPAIPAWLMPGEADPLSQALRQLSVQLEKVSLSMDVGCDFLPRDDELWPHMREVDVISMDRWTKDVEDDISENNQGQLERPSYHTRIDSNSDFHDRINQHYLISGQVAARMPNLRYMRMFWANDFDACCIYTAEHNPPSAKVTICKAPALASGLRQDVEAVWCTTAITHLGEGAELRFELEFDDGDISRQDHIRNGNEEYLEFVWSRNSKWTYTTDWAHRLKWTRTV